MIQSLLSMLTIWLISKLSYFLQKYSASEFYAGSHSFPSRLSLSWINCTSTAVWQIPIASMSINTTSFPLTQATALIDTSLSMILIPETPF